MGPSAAAVSAALGVVPPSVIEERVNADSTDGSSSSGSVNRSSSSSSFPTVDASAAADILWSGEDRDRAEIYAMLNVMRAFHGHLTSQHRHLVNLMRDPRHVGYHVNPWTYYADGFTDRDPFRPPLSLGVRGADGEVELETCPKYSESVEEYSDALKDTILSSRMYAACLTECAPLFEAAYAGGPATAALDFCGPDHGYLRSLYAVTLELDEEYDPSVLEDVRADLRRDRALLYLSRYLDVRPFEVTEDGGLVFGDPPAEEDDVGGVSGVLCALADRLLSFVDYCLGSPVDDGSTSSMAEAEAEGDEEDVENVDPASVVHLLTPRSVLRRESARTRVHGTWEPGPSPSSEPAGVESPELASAFTSFESLGFGAV